MGLLEIILVGIGLSMDAAAVSICNGMTMKNVTIKKATIISTLFGFFQGLMPIIGFYIGSLFSSFISNIDHYVAFILLTILGIKMIYEAIESKDEVQCKEMTFKVLLLQSIATSIDALVVGLSFAALGINIYLGSSMIALTTFLICFIAVFLGKKFGKFLQNKAEIFGGIILILIGIKIFIEHLFF